MPCRKAKARATEQTVNASLAPEHFGKRLRNKAKAKAQQFQCALSISDGRTTVGAVARCGARQVATDADGTTVGNFATPTGEQGRLTESDLRELYPAVFNGQRQPLKIGIHVDLKIGGNTEVMHRWTRHPLYLRNLIAGGARYDLDGRAAGSVSRDEQLHAQLELAQCVFQIKSRKCGGSS